MGIVIKKKRSEGEPRESAGGDFFNRSGWSSVPPKGGAAGEYGTRKFTLRDGESAVIRILQPEPTAVHTHSVKMSSRERDFRLIVCPEQNPKWAGKCPVMGKRGDHYPSWRGLFSVVDMRTLWQWRNPNNKDDVKYLYDLSDYSYEPPVDDEQYDSLGEPFEVDGRAPVSGKDGWKVFLPQVKVFWMSSDAARELQNFAKVLRKRCINCNENDEKSDRIRKDSEGDLSCACGDPKPASITDVYVKVTRHGADVSTKYVFTLSEHFGFAPAPLDKDGNEFKPVRYADEIKVPTPEEVRNLLPAESRGE